MFKEEARWIRDALAGANLKPSARVLDVGASNLRFRTLAQPHIHELIHKPLSERGGRISFLDIKNDDGVDLVVDLTAKNLPDSLFTDTFDLIICCNILEHVNNRETFLRNLLRFSHVGTLLMVTVPLVYPKHEDPIDTMYRPTVRRLIEFIDAHVRCRVLASEELVITDKEYYVLKPGRKLDYLLVRAPRILVRWYVKPWRWKVSCVLLEIEQQPG